MRLFGYIENNAQITLTLKQKVRWSFLAHIKLYMLYMHACLIIYACFKKTHKIAFLKLF